jgi:hypothetical protein
VASNLLSVVLICFVCKDTGCRIDFFPVNCPRSSERVVRVCGTPSLVVQSIYQLCSLLLYVSANESVVDSLAYDRDSHFA